MQNATRMDDAFRHIQSRAYLACDVVGDPASTFDDVDMAGGALEDLARQVAGIGWSHSGYLELYEEIGKIRGAALGRMARHLSAEAPCTTAVHVTPYGRGWAVRRADDGQPVTQHAAMQDAVAEGFRLATQLVAELVVYDEAWQVSKHVPPGGGRSKVPWD